MPQGGGCNHVIATTDLHSKVKKHRYKLREQLYGQSHDSAMGALYAMGALCVDGSMRFSTKLMMSGRQICLL